MKKLNLLVSAILLTLISTISYAQPLSFNYQAVLRDANGSIIANQNVTMEFAIRSGSSGGAVQYNEEQVLTTNEFGLVNHAVGTGTTIFGNIDNVNWGASPKFLRVRLDNGGGMVTIGTQQLVSVPYAIESRNAQNADFASDSDFATFAGNATNANNATNATTAERVNGGNLNVDGNSGNKISYTNSSINENATFIRSEITAANDFNFLVFRNAAGVVHQMRNDGRAGFGSGSSGNVQLLVDPQGNLDYGIFISHPDAQEFALYVAGEAAKPGGSSWIVASDERLKDQVAPYTDGLSTLLSINPVTYHYNKRSGFNTSKKQIGVIAQELKQVAPYMVGESKISEDGNEEFLNVDNSAMTYMLINAVKDQQEQIDALKTEIEALKNK